MENLNLRSSPLPQTQLKILYHGLGVFKPPTLRKHVDTVSQISRVNFRARLVVYLSVVFCETVSNGGKAKPDSLWKRGVFSHKFAIELGGRVGF